MIVETKCLYIVELVNSRAGTFRAEFYAPLSVTLHVVALCIEVSLAFAMYVDIRSGGDGFCK